MLLPVLDLLNGLNVGNCGIMRIAKLPPFTLYRIVYEPHARCGDETAVFGAVMRDLVPPLKRSPPTIYFEMNGPPDQSFQKYMVPP